MTFAFITTALVTCGLLVLCAREVRLRRAAQQVAARLFAVLNHYRPTGDSTYGKPRSFRR